MHKEGSLSQSVSLQGMHLSAQTSGYPWWGSSGWWGWCLSWWHISHFIISQGPHCIGSTEQACSSQTLHSSSQWSTWGSGWWGWTLLLITSSKLT